MHGMEETLPPGPGAALFWLGVLWYHVGKDAGGNENAESPLILSLSCISCNPFSQCLGSSQQMWRLSMASSLWMGQGCSLQAEGRIKGKMGWTFWDSTWKIREWCSLTSSGEFRSSKSSSILSTNSSVNRICKGNTVFYAFTLLVLANCKEQHDFCKEQTVPTHSFPYVLLYRNTKVWGQGVPNFVFHPNHWKKCWNYTAIFFDPQLSSSV